MMLFVYSFIITILSPIAGVLFLLSKKGRVKLYQRFGIWGQLDKSCEWIWFHAASLGEVGGIEAVINKLKKDSSGSKSKILITVTSAAALDKAAKFADQVRLLPFDSYIFYWLALRQLNIKKAVFTETEIWPSLIGFLSFRQITITWINARMMFSSFTRYINNSWFFRSIFLKIDSIAAQTSTDADRFRKCGAIDVQVLGNAKYEQNDKTTLLEESILSFIKSLNSSVISITNIRPQEEKFIFQAINKNQNTALFLVMPRHKEAYSYFQKAFHEYGINYITFDQFVNTRIKTGVVFVDRFGILEDLVSVSSAVIAAGAFLPKYKGHNLLVASQYTIPMCTGKYNESSQPILDELKANEAVFIAHNSQDIIGFIQLILDKSESLSFQAARSNKYLKTHFGAVDRIVNWILNTNRKATTGGNVFSYLLTPILCVLSYVFIFVTYGRNKLFDLKVFKSYKSKKYVISVGNLSVGGTGKTPLVIKLVLDLISKGYKCAVLSRGYGGRLKGPYVISKENINSISYSDVGDEPLEIFHSTNVPVVIAKNRVSGAKLIEDQNLADIIILDDGFQHRWLCRDKDIVCIDVSSLASVRKFLSGYLIPFGILRESPRIAASRIDKIVFSTRQSADNDLNIDSWIKSIKLQLPNIESTVSYYSKPVLSSTLSTTLADCDFQSRKAFVFCGIGNPQGFVNTINKFNLNIELPIIQYKDHYVFTQFDLNLIQEKINSDYLVITTRKDYMRLPEVIRNKIYYLDVSLITEPDLVSVLLPSELPTSAF